MELTHKKGRYWPLDFPFFRIGTQEHGAPSPKGGNRQGRAIAGKISPESCRQQVYSSARTKQVSQKKRKKHTEGGPASSFLTLYCCTSTLNQRPKELIMNSSVPKNNSCLPSETATSVASSWSSIVPNDVPVYGHENLYLKGGPTSPTAATDDSSMTDIRNVDSLDSLDVPDTPTSDCHDGEESGTPLSIGWNTSQQEDPSEDDACSVLGMEEQDPYVDVSHVPPREDSQNPSHPLYDLQELRRLEQEEAVKESTKEPFDPLKMLRKGAVAALGGTMVGVGLIMIPLPTPFGVVVASSGMAVLGTEFEGAKEMNDKVMATTKKHWDAARENIIKNIEEMEDAGRPTTIDSHSHSHEQGEDKEPLAESGASLLMNDAERLRQNEIAKQRKEAEPNIFDQWKRSTGAYLSRHLVPILKRSGSEVASIPDADFTVQSETETISDLDDQTEILVTTCSRCTEEETTSFTDVPAAAAIIQVTAEEVVMSNFDKSTLTMSPVMDDAVVSL